MSDGLAVWLGDEPVGDLARSGRRSALRFTRQPDATPQLTVAAAGADPAWTPSFTHAWFDNLLPEDGRRTVAETEHGVERGDTFGLLPAIGCSRGIGSSPGRAAGVGRMRR